MVTESNLISRRQALQWAAAAGLGSFVVSFSLWHLLQDPGQESLVSKTTGVDYTELDQALGNRNWKEADQLTAKLMLQVADPSGKAFEARRTDIFIRLQGADPSDKSWGARRFNDDSIIREFPGEDLKLIDQLWVKHSNGTLGFSVQKRIWKECGSPGSDYSANRSAWIEFGNRVNWQGGWSEEGWRDYDELNWTDPQKNPGHLPVIETRIRYDNPDEIPSFKVCEHFGVDDARWKKCEDEYFRAFASVTGYAELKTISSLADRFEL